MNSLKIRILKDIPSLGVKAEEVHEARKATICEHGRNGPVWFIQVDGTGSWYGILGDEARAIHETTQEQPEITQRELRDLSFKPGKVTFHPIFLPPEHG